MSSNKPQGSKKKPQDRAIKQGTHENKKDRQNTRTQNEDENFKKIPPKPQEPEKRKLEIQSGCGVASIWLRHFNQLKIAGLICMRRSRKTGQLVAHEATALSQSNSNHLAIMITIAQIVSQINDGYAWHGNFMFMHEAPTLMHSFTFIQFIIVSTTNHFFFIHLATN